VLRSSAAAETGKRCARENLGRQPDCSLVDVEVGRVVRAATGAA
jgi:hypothetical protein